MTDTRTPEQRRRIMEAVRSVDTGPEVALRRALYAAGVRGWRCHYKRAAGKPDLAWPALRVAVFVDGAFWHGHPSRHKPGRSGAYWDEKIARNVQRDREIDARLEGEGWTVLRVWDFEVARQLDRVVGRVQRALADAASALGPRRRVCRGESGSPGPTFGQNLRAARHAAGLTQADLAHCAGLERSTISLYEQSLREPNLRTVLRFARVLKIDASELVRGL